MNETLDSIMATLPLGGDLPDLRFFDPTPGFLSAMECFRGLPIYDVGCGCGHVAEALRARDLTCFGIDVSVRPSQHAVVIANGVAFNYAPGGVVLLCRPCHGPFVEAVVRRAVRRQARAVVYVGLPKNKRGDLGAFARRFRLAATGVGKEGERMYLLDLR